MNGGSAQDHNSSKPTPREAAEQALREAGFSYNAEYEIWTRPNCWSETFHNVDGNGLPVWIDKVWFFPQPSTGVAVRYTAEIIGYAAELPAFLRSGYSQEQIEKAIADTIAAVRDKQNGWTKAGRECAEQFAEMLRRQFAVADAKPQSNHAKMLEAIRLVKEVYADMKDYKAGSLLRSFMPDLIVKLETQSDWVEGITREEDAKTPSE